MSDNFVRQFCPTIIVAINGTHFWYLFFSTINEINSLKNREKNGPISMPNY